jgi:hypothetical protein
MLIALVIALLLTGGAGGGGLEVFDKHERKLVLESVVDEARAAAVVAEMKSSQKSFDRAAKQLNGLIKDWDKTNQNRASGRSDLEPIMRQADELRVETQATFVDAIFEMRKHLTVEEWKAIMAPLDRDQRAEEG